MNTAYIAKTYASLIMKNVKTIDEVPEQIRAEVEKALQEMRESENL